jgi:hypothetical protein
MNTDENRSENFVLISVLNTSVLICVYLWLKLFSIRKTAADHEPTGVFRYKTPSGGRRRESWKGLPA